MNFCCDSEYVEPEFVDTDPGTVITPILDDYLVILALSKIKKSAPDPNGILLWAWKEHADIIAPVILNCNMEAITEETHLVICLETRKYQSST